MARRWQKIVTGFPADEMVRVVREDPKRKGLLYAGTDTGVFVSWDDGDHWQPLTLNLPPTPITDLQVHDNDLADLDLRPLAMDPRRRDAATRDDSEVRCLPTSHLFTPETAIRVRWDNYEDTPFPVETPAGRIRRTARS